MEGLAHDARVTRLAHIRADQLLNAAHGEYTAISQTPGQITPDYEAVGAAVLIHDRLTALARDLRDDYYIALGKLAVHILKYADAQGIGHIVTHRFLAENLGAHLNLTPLGTTAMSSAVNWMLADKWLTSNWTAGMNPDDQIVKVGPQPVKAGTTARFGSL